MLRGRIGRMTRFVPVTLGIVFFAIPLFPAFITLTGVSVPGVSLVPPPLAVGLIAFMFAVAVYWSIVLATSPGPRMPTVLPLALFPLAGVAAAALGFDPLAGALFIVILSFGVVWHAFVIRFFGQPHVATTIYCCFLLSGALAAAVAIVMVATKFPAAVYTVGHGRAIGTFILPGELAGYLIVYLPLAYALARAAPRRDLRVLAGVGTVIGAIAFVLTFSRAGWVGLAAAIAFIVFMHRRRAGKRYAIAVLGVAVVALGFAFNARHDPSENFTRISIWQAAFGMIERFPLTGVGPFDFAKIYQLLRLPDGEPTAFHAHSFLLMVAAEIGLVGLAAVLFGWWRFSTLFGERLRTSTGASTVAIAIVAGLVGTWVQGLIDTVSIVIFALWYPFMALALTAGDDTANEATTAVAARQRAWRPQHMRRRALLGAAVALVAVPCAYVQLASAATFAGAGVPLSFPSRLAPALGAQLYAAIERVAPLPFVEAMLTRAALQRGDLTAAEAHAARMPADTLRSEDRARIALARGRRNDAIESFLDAGDDGALQAEVVELSASGRVRDAYLLERRIRDRLDASKTRPNAVADSWWRLGRLATRLHVPGEAQDDYARASALAPLNTKYLLDAGTLALQDRRTDAAWSLFARAADLDPASADSVAGLGLAALERGDRAQAQRLADRARHLNPRASLVIRLQRAIAPSPG